jgi:nucleoside-diphosphate-sugar epimerase
MRTNQRILITGGTGFIRTHLAERLCNNHSVIRVNLLGTARLLDALPGTPVRTLVYFSTIEVLGPDSLHAAQSFGMNGSNMPTYGRVHPISRKRSTSWATNQR